MFMRRMLPMFRMLCGSIWRSLTFRYWVFVMVSKRLLIIMEGVWLLVVIVNMVMLLLRLLIIFQVIEWGFYDE